MDRQGLGNKAGGEMHWHPAVLPAGEQALL
jgi:hypothetical protein